MHEIIFTERLVFCITQYYFYYVIKHISIMAHLEYNEAINEIRNGMDAVICEALPSNIDGKYAGNYRVRMRQMVEAWNATFGQDVTPQEIFDVIESLAYKLGDAASERDLSQVEHVSWKKISDLYAKMSAARIKFIQ